MSELSERALMKTSIRATTKTLFHSILLTRFIRFALASLNMHTISHEFARRRFPLMIDPQLQGVAWIKQFAGSDETKPLQIARLGNKDLLSKMKVALENGYPMLIENMGEAIDAIIMPVIQRSSVKRGGKFWTKLDDDEVEFKHELQAVHAHEAEQPPLRARDSGRVHVG